MSSCPIFLFIILLTTEFPIWCCGGNSSLGCVPRERKALLKFKASLFDPSNRLSSWDEYDDCCAWDGVMCDKTTGHVIELDLRNNNTEDYSKFLQGNQLDSCLLELKYLSYLDLSYNDFQSSPIPAFLGSMKHLVYLNLSAASFGGHDLTWASNLTSLETLDLSMFDLSRSKNLVKVLNMLPSLLVLSLSATDIDKTNMGHGYVNSTPFTHITYLDLSWNSFEGEFPYFLQNMTSLRFLDLSSNRYNTSGPHLIGLRDLVHLNLGDNWLDNVDWISEVLPDKCHLKMLNLYGNHFYGEISGFFKNSSGCSWMDKLEKLGLERNAFYGNLPEEMGELKQLNQLHLSFNNFSGPIPWSLGQLSALTELDMSNNMLSGSIPSSLGNIRSLRVLNIRSNQLSGKIPISLGQLSNLESIDFSLNSFNGTTLYEVHFDKLSKLESLSANLLKFQMRLDWMPPFQLKSFELRSCDIGGIFPPWLRNQKSLRRLGLSNCSISGPLPNWLQYINLSYLDLSNNHIEGPLQYLFSNITNLYLSNNMINHLPRDIGHMIPLVRDFFLSHNSINGSMPASLCEMKALELLDLSNNYLSGNILGCWENFPDLFFMKLSSNELSGIIPKSIGLASSLQWLQLNNNRLTGQLPSSLKNCTNLQALDVGGNNLSGNLPRWFGKYLLRLQFLILRYNEFYGVIPSEFCQLSSLQIMDLAHNKLTGKIPYCIGNFSNMVKLDYQNPIYGWSLEQVIVGVEREFTGAKYLVNFDLSDNNLIGEIPWELTNLSALVGLNLSHNHLEGKIPAKIGDLKSLIFLDFSSNKLFGTIPDSLSSLNFLSYLNLSHNKLSGQIPTGNQLQTLEDPSIYSDNPQLCGAPLLKKCRDNKAPTASTGEDHVIIIDEGDRAEKLYLYGFIISGFATGFWGIIGVLIIKESWRQTFFRFVNVVFDKMFGS